MKLCVESSGLVSTMLGAGMGLCSSCAGVNIVSFLLLESETHMFPVVSKATASAHADAPPPSLTEVVGVSAPDVASTLELYARIGLSMSQPGSHNLPVPLRLTYVAVALSLTVTLALETDPSKASLTTASLERTCGAFTVYVPKASCEIVVLVLTVVLYPFGPLTCTLAVTPAGVVTLTVRLPVGVPGHAVRLRTSRPERIRALRGRGFI